MSLVSSRWSVTSIGPVEAQKLTGWSKSRCSIRWNWPRTVCGHLHFTRFAFYFFPSLFPFHYLNKASFEKSNILRLYLNLDSTGNGEEWNNSFHYRSAIFLLGQRFISKYGTLALNGSFGKWRIDEEELVLSIKYNRRTPDCYTWNMSCFSPKNVIFLSRRLFTNSSKECVFPQVIG